MSRIGWVDFSSTDRMRVQEVLALMKEKGTLDELGIGQVRDAYSDLLFPGFSTIQTNARYFLAVPKILREWASMTPRRRRNAGLARYLEVAEDQLAASLVKNHLAESLPLDGIIGHTMIESGGVARRPSSTYWNGLRIFGIVRSEKSLAEFCREWLHDITDSDALEAEDGVDDAESTFDADVKLAPGTRGASLSDLTLRLSPIEAEFLSTQFQTARGLSDSVAAQLLTTNLAVSAIGEELRQFAAFSTWAVQQDAISSKCRQHIVSAQRFSLAIEGAHILFNQILAKRLESEELRMRCERDYPVWKALAEHNKIFNEKAPDEWLRTSILGAKSFKDLTSDFLKNWNRAHCDGSDVDYLEILVAKQAIANKKERSLLVRLPRSASDWYGMKELDYRWSTARQMLKDITRVL